jgi:hypothetical protein
VKPDSIVLLKGMFVLGAIVDGANACTWFLIAGGMNLPNILNGYTGSGADYRLAMFIGAMFLAGWGVILAWGALRPLERRGLLLITSVFLILSVIAELLFFRSMLMGAGFYLGITKRTIIALLAASIYAYSFKHQRA